jgi:hypothetical protein
MDVFTQHVTVGKIREKLAADGAFRDEIADQILRSMLLDYATTVIAR